MKENGLSLMLRNANPHSSEDPIPSTIKTGDITGTLLADRTSIEHSTSKLLGVHIYLQLNFKNHVASLGEQGWRSGESTRLPPLWPRFDSRTRRPMWVEFVVGSRPCSKGFSPGSLVFLPPQKSTLLNFYWIWNQWMKSHLVEMPLQIRYCYY